MQANGSSPFLSKFPYSQAILDLALQVVLIILNMKLIHYIPFGKRYMDVLDKAWSLEYL